MEIREISMVLNRKNDTNVSAVIIPGITENDINLSIQFRTITAYKQFIKNPALSEELFDDIDANFFCNTEMKNIVKQEDFLKRLHNINLLCRVSKSKKRKRIVIKATFPNHNEH